MTYNNRCPQCGGEGRYIGRQEVPPSRFGGRRYVSLYECEQCETSFMEPGASEAVKKVYNEGIMEYTEDEVREKFLRHVWMVIGYWENESREAETRGKLEGLAFSILCMLDGSAAEMPGFVVEPHPHEDDKEYQRSRGERWYPESGCDIAGCLHELFHKYKPESV